MDPRVREQIGRAPREPGVYLFKGAKGRVLYVGKAKSLHNRLKSYLTPERDERPSIPVMMGLARQVEWLLTDNEKEALLLENNLIKSYRPRYNIFLRDDKSYVSLKLTKHAFPSLYVTRKIVKDGSTYSGPYSSAHDLRETLKVIQKIFRIRDCSDSFFSNRSRPCLQHQIRRCTGPCVGFVSEAAYAEQVREASLFIAGDKRALSDRLKAEMAKASDELRYEDAAQARDRLRAIDDSLTPQKVESRQDDWNADALGICGDESATLLKVLRVRRGRMVGTEEYFLEEPISAKQEIVRSFLQQIYLNEEASRRRPDDIVLTDVVPDAATFEELSGVKIRRPKRGKAAHILELAERNALEAFGERKRQSEGNLSLLEELRRELGLAKPPKRIEGYDISNTQGGEPVGSQVVFIDGEPDKHLYRHYGIRTVKGSNDFAMLKEVFERRFRKLAPENRPDLVLIDGGRGQLSQLTQVFKDLAISDLAFCSIAKEKELVSRSGKKYAPERIFLPGQKNPLVFPPSSKVLHLLMRVRDEAHRFGITHHRKLRGKRALTSVLARIPGVGPKRRRDLLNAFTSIEEIQVASVEQLAAVKGIARPVAESIHGFFRSGA